MSLSLCLYADACECLAGGMNANLTAIEHLNTSNIEMFPRTSTDDLGKGRDTNTHQFASGTLLCLLTAEFLIAYILHCQPQRTFIIATIVGPVQSGAIWEGFGLNEVL